MDVWSFWWLWNSQSTNYWTYSTYPTGSQLDLHEGWLVANFHTVARWICDVDLTATNSATSCEFFGNLLCSMQNQWSGRSLGKGTDLRVLLASMFALHVFGVSALLVSTDFCCTGQLFVRAPPSASLQHAGIYACARRLLGLMHIYICMHMLLPIFFYPVTLEKVTLAAAFRCEAWTCLCVLFYCLASSRVKNPSGRWMLSSEFWVIHCCSFFEVWTSRGRSWWPTSLLGLARQRWQRALGRSWQVPLTTCLAAGRVDLRDTTVQAKW